MEIVIDKDIKLCKILVEDAEILYDIIDSQREYLQEWLPFVPLTTSSRDTKDFIEMTLAKPEEEQDLTFTIHYRGEVVGLIGYKDTDYVNRRVELGYWISYDYQGQGIMTRATRKLCEYAFDVLKLHRVQIRCGVGNIASGNIPKRLGFSFEGIERDGEYHPDNRYIDLEVYSLLQGELQ